MPGKKCADIVFLLDASASMAPCISEVKDNIGRLVDFFRSDNQSTWDVRLEFIAHASCDGLYHIRSHSLVGPKLLDQLYKPQSHSDKSFFTNDVGSFQSALSDVDAQGDETTLVALDIALDVPWRPAEGCHRVVICLSDEAIETGESVSLQKSQLGALVKKIHAKRIKLFIIAPQSAVFDELSMADRCEYEPVDAANSGLRNTNFRKLMEAIGKSVSVSQNTMSGASAPQPLYGQDKWGIGHGIFGADGSH
jgi:hypothetical protein